MTNFKSALSPRRSVILHIYVLFCKTYEYWIAYTSTHTWIWALHLAVKIMRLPTTAPIHVYIRRFFQCYTGSLHSSRYTTHVNTPTFQMKILYQPRLFFQSHINLSVWFIHSFFINEKPSHTMLLYPKQFFFIIMRGFCCCSLCVMFLFFWEMMIGVDCWLWWRNRWWCLCFFIFLLRNHTTKTMEFKRFLNSNKNI